MVWQGNDFLTKIVWRDVEMISKQYVGNTYVIFMMEFNLVICILIMVNDKYLTY